MQIYIVFYLHLMHNIVTLFLMLQMTPLQKIRHKRKLTCKQVADEIGVHESAMYRLENGLIWPSKETVEKLVALFNKRIKEVEILWPERYIE